MSDSNVILSSIIAIIVFVMYMATMYYTTRKDTVRERVERLAGSTGEPVETYDSLESDREYTPTGKILDGILRMLTVDTEGFRKNSQLRFYRAGIQTPDATVNYLFFKYIVSIFLLIMAMFIAISYADGVMQHILHWMIAGILVITGVVGPDIYLSNLRAKREKKLLRSFPDMLDLLLVCVEAGLALDGALARVCRELGFVYPEMTQELNRTRMELTLLNDRGAALSNLAERTDMVCFRTLVTTLLQSERFGTSLTDTMRVLSEDYRTTRLMMAENAAGRLPALITIPMILMMMPALFLVILAPAIIKALAVNGCIICMGGRQ